MKINLPVRYEVDKRKGIVIARFQESYFDPVAYAKLHKPLHNMYIPWMPAICLSELEAKAKCFPGNEERPADKYDVETGKKLARTRLTRIFYKKLEKVFDQTEKRMEKSRAGFERFACQAFYKALNCQDHLHDLIEKTKEKE